METINCDICGDQRPQIEMIPAEFDDENYAVCVHCVESELREREVVVPERLVDYMGRW